MKWALSIQVAVMDQVGAANQVAVVGEVAVVDKMAVGDGGTSSEETPPSCTLCVYVLHTHMTQQQKRNLKKLQVNEVDEVTRRTTCAMSRSAPRCHVLQRTTCAAPRSDLSGGCPGRQIRGLWAGCRDVRGRTRA